MAVEADKLSENMEDYLEVIYALSKARGMARVSEIAREMKVKNPSVNAALKVLADRGLVEHEKYGYAHLTKEGERLAAAVQGKHDILFRFLTEFLMLKPAVAEREACSIEHAISKGTFMRLVKFVKFLKGAGQPGLLNHFAGYLRAGGKAWPARGRLRR